MNTYGYVSVETVMEKVLGILPANVVYNISEIVEHIYDSIKLIGTDLNLIYEEVDITVKNNKALIPKNVETIINIRYNTIDLVRENKFPSEKLFMYFINNEVIYTDLDDCVITLETKKFPIDDREYPLVPGNFVYINAIVNYIAERLAYKLYLQDKLNEHKYNRYERERFIHMESAKSYSRLPQTKGDELALEMSLSKLVEQRGRGFNVRQTNANTLISIDEFSNLIGKYEDNKA